MSKRSVSPLWLIVGASLWMAVAGNGALWRRLNGLGLLNSWQGWAFTVGMSVVICAALMLILGLLSWRATLKPASIVLVVATALASHFMLRYGVVIDPGMMVNLLQTDTREAGALLNLGALASLLFLGLVPAWLIWRQRVDYGSLRRQLGRNAALVAVAISLLALTLLASFQTLASVTHNHKEVRYLINPLNSLYALGNVLTQPLRRDTSKRLPLGEDASLPPTQATRARPSLLVLVLGETARSDHFGINGYPRPTTPSLEREGALSFRNAWSCGTSTAASVPCMFSHLPREQFESRKTEFEGLLDVLQRAGLAVLWVDNQSGCKGVCERVPHATVNPAENPTLCSDGECLDMALLEGLDARLAKLDPERRARGTVVVLHQMGSHGPAYHRHSPATQKRFLPECTNTDLQGCGRDSLVNAYDNSIAYTDHFLGQVIDWLKRRETGADTALLYVSDHGESLGENNLYLHGLPYAFAPDTQKRVPWVTWLSENYRHSTGLDAGCLVTQRDAHLSHDNYFHSVLGLMEVQTSAYQASLDVYASCRNR